MMEFNKQELRIIMNALRLQVETYRKIELAPNIDEEELANVIMDRGYTESLLDAIADDYKKQNPQWMSTKPLGQMG